MKSQNIIYFKIAQVKDEQIQKSILFETADILEDGDDQLIAVEDFGDFEVIYSFLPFYKAERFLALLEKFNILIDYKDVTEDVLMAREKGREFIGTFQDDTYKRVLERFSEDTLTVDMVLDKINEQGIDSLTDLDREVLKKI